MKKSLLVIVLLLGATTSLYTTAGKKQKKKEWQQTDLYGNSSSPKTLSTNQSNPDSAETNNDLIEQPGKNLSTSTKDPSSDTNNSDANSQCSEDSENVLLKLLAKVATSEVHSVKGKTKDSSSTDKIEDPVVGTIKDSHENETEEQLKKAIDFCQGEEGYFAGWEVTYALNWSSKEVISQERSTARKAITDGLHKLYKQNEEDFKKLQKLMDKSLAEKLKTDTLVNALQVAENISKRFEVAYHIINNKANIQIDETNLNEFTKLHAQYFDFIKTLFGVQFDFETKKLENLDRIRHRIQKKSLKPAAIFYECLTQQLISSALIGKGLNAIEDINPEFEANESDIDEETHNAAIYYNSSPSWWSPKRSNIRKGLVHTEEEIEKENKSTAAKDLTDAMQTLIQDSNEYCATESNATDLQALLTQMKNSEVKQRKLATARYLLKTGKIQWAETDLSDLNAACSTGQAMDKRTLKQSFSRVQNRLKRGNEMCLQVAKKSLAGIQYSEIDTASSTIFSASQTLFAQLREKNEAEKKLAAAAELAESQL